MESWKDRRSSFTDEGEGRIPHSGRLRCEGDGNDDENRDWGRGMSLGSTSTSMFYCSTSTTISQ